MAVLHYDYIIIGAGAAGLMLADAMAKDAFFKDSSILLLDKDTKTNNDRTWCFWEKGEGQFDAIVHKKWNHVYFAGQQFSKRFKIAPYTYKMIQGIDFYNTVLESIKPNANINFEQAAVTHVKDEGAHVTVTTEEKTYTGRKVFNSMFSYEKTTQQKKYPVLQQHFIGWFVKTKQPVFDPDQATYMDFSIAQKGNTRFMYVLPTSETEALIEYTLFSEHLLPKEEYETAIKDYLKNDLGCSDYDVVDTEMGSIPMTCYDFKDQHTANMRYIGMAGGWAKPSTGYTFMSTAKKIPKLIAHIKTGDPLQHLSYKTKFWYYDLLFLDVLYKDNAKGYHVFETLFKNRKPQQVFKFLDEETNFAEDVGNMMGSPIIPFIKALLGRVFRPLK